MKIKNRLTRLKHLGILSLGCLMIWSCTSGSRISTQQMQLDGVKRELLYLKDQNSQLRREMQDLKSQLTEQEQSNRQTKADLMSQFSEVSQQLEIVQNQLRDAQYRMDSFRQSSRPGTSAAQPDPFATNPDTSSVTSNRPSLGIDESRELYNTAYRDLIRGNYQLALYSFQQFTRQYPSSELIDNAQYWLGEVYYAQGRYSQAIQEFEKVVRWYPNADKKASALLKIGYAYINIDEIEQGKLYLEEVIKDHPDSEEANLAKGRLTALQ